MIPGMIEIVGHQTKLNFLNKRDIEIRENKKLFLLMTLGFNYRILNECGPIKSTKSENFT